MLEKVVEKHLVKCVQGRGGECLKWSSPSNRGVPDRIVILPGGHIGFVECKAPGRKPSALQAFWMERLRELGFWAGGLDDKADAEKILEEIVRFHL